MELHTTRRTGPWTVSPYRRSTGPCSRGRCRQAPGAGVGGLCQARRSCTRRWRCASGRGSRPHSRSHRRERNADMCRRQSWCRTPARARPCSPWSAARVARTRIDRWGRPRRHRRGGGRGPAARWKASSGKRGGNARAACSPPHSHSIRVIAPGSASHYEINRIQSSQS
jgi:hypothetical protein